MPEPTNPPNVIPVKETPQKNMGLHTQETDPNEPCVQEVLDRRDGGAHDDVQENLPQVDVSGKNKAVKTHKFILHHSPCLKKLSTNIGPSKN